MTRWEIATVLLFLACAFTPRCSWAGTVRVTPDLVCQTQHAIRWREHAWTQQQCQTRAAEFAVSGQRWGVEPTTLLAIAIVESDLRPSAVRQDGLAWDVGLMGVRCVSSERAPARGARCLAGPARGRSIQDLLVPAISIDLGAKILSTVHHGSLTAYNGGRREHGYTENVAGILAALGGIEVRAKSARIRKLIAQIAKGDIQ